MKIKRLGAYFITVFLAVCCFCGTLTVPASAASIKCSLVYTSEYTAIKATKINAEDTIRFTTDGTDPTVNSREYTKKIAFTKPAVVKFAEFDKNGNQVGKIKTLNVERLIPKPKFNVVDNFDGTVTVKIVDDQEGVTIHYTRDGSDPTEKSPVMPSDKALKVKKDIEIKAIAMAEGYHESMIASIRPFDLVTEKSYDDYIKAAFNKTNEIRAEHGLEPLKLNESLCKAALVRAKELRQSYGHTRPDGRKWSTEYAEVGYEYWYASENYAKILRCGIAPERMIELWMISKEHSEAILNTKGSDVGLGFYQADGYCYWIQLFGGKMSEYPGRS